MSCIVAFSGQGRQFPEMFHFLKSNAFGLSWLADASKRLNKNLMDDKVIADCCYDVLYSQLFIALLSVGAFRAMQQQCSFEPLLCGYSLGEVSAFCVSAELSMDEICQLVEMRVNVMQAALDGSTQHRPAGLVALKGHMNISDAQQLTQQYQCYIAIINGSDHYIVGGEESNLNQLMDAAKARGISKVEKLAVKLPSHTPLLASASPAFLSYLQHQFNNSQLAYPILNAMTAEVTTSTSAMLTMLANELSHTLHWDKVLQIAGEYGVSPFLELGPRSDLKHMFTATNPDIAAYALDDFATVDGICKHALNYSPHNDTGDSK